MKRILSLLCLCMSIISSASSPDGKLHFNHIYAPQEGLVNRTEKPYREEICLNGSWEFQPVALPEDYVYGKGMAPQLPLPEADSWDKVRIKIPSPWNVNDFAYRNLEGPDHRNYPSYPQEWNDVKMAWMRRTVDIPQDWTGKQIRLHFEAVAGAAEVYVNGRKVAENFDLFLPFSPDVTEYVKPGETVEILVGVRSQQLFEDRSTTGRRVVPAGSMWGYHINGIWQDVYLQAFPMVRIEDVFVKPLVSKGILAVEVTLVNQTRKDADVILGGTVQEWLNKAGTDVLSAPVPAWELGETELVAEDMKVRIPAGGKLVRQMELPVDEGVLEYWTPEHPNLHALILTICGKRQTIDRKYTRFGWREWTIEGTTHCLNGRPYALKGDSWHFMGIPQMTRRYAWAWFRAIKDMNGNAVRPHAQVYPRFYLDMADEMGICVLNETANWASDGGPKLDSDHFWKASKGHLERFVLRDRNHPAVFGWSVSNENKPVILYVFNRPELLPLQEKAWEEWRDIVRRNDPTRPWISSDGEDDGNGILPVTVGHYGDEHSMRHWMEIGKPWGIGEHSMAYYGTPEQVSKYNGERAYESQFGRMEGLAVECYDLIASQRNQGASYSTVFNMVWYALRPLPFGKRDLSAKPDMEDGIFFGEYVEDMPGVQPERIGPYSSTLNPGYDPSLPLYDPWPLFDAMRAANAPDGPEWCKWAETPVQQQIEPMCAEPYEQVLFIGADDSPLKKIMDAQGVVFTPKAGKPRKSGNPQKAIAIVDGSSIPSEKDLKVLTDKGMHTWIWGLVPQTVDAFNAILPYPVETDCLSRSSFLPVQKSWMRGLKNSDFYFCELQKSDAARYTLKGQFVEEGDVLLEACRTDWRTWNKRAEKLKTAAVLRSENECTAAAPVFVRNGNVYISTLTDFANTGKGYRTLAAILDHAGIPCDRSGIAVEDMFFLQDGRLIFPDSINEKIEDKKLTVYVYSPRPLDDLLIEPNMPKLTLVFNDNSCKLTLNGIPRSADVQDGNGTTYHELPLLQGWNSLEISIGAVEERTLGGYFECTNRQEYVPMLQVRFTNPE